MRTFFDKIGGRNMGLMGSVLFHMLLVIVFLATRINAERERTYEGIELDLRTLQELAMLEFETPEIDVPDPGAAARNIAVEQVEDRIERFDDYQNYELSGQQVNNIVENRVQESIDKIIEDNNLNPDDTELPDIATEKLELYAPKELKEEEVYEGPTNIFFTLKDRKITKLRVPVYQCEGGGLVKLDIRVSRRGKVEWVSVDTATSTTEDSCLIDAAKRAARLTIFNFDSGAPLLQSGSISFRFVAQ